MGNFSKPIWKTWGKHRENMGTSNNKWRKHGENMCKPNNLNGKKEKCNRNGESGELGFDCAFCIWVMIDGNSRSLSYFFMGYAEI